MHRVQTEFSLIRQEVRSNNEKNVTACRGSPREAPIASEIQPVEIAFDPPTRNFYDDMRLEVDQLHNEVNSLTWAPDLCKKVPRQKQQPAPPKKKMDPYAGKHVAVSSGPHIPPSIPHQAIQMSTQRPKHLKDCGLKLLELPDRVRPIRMTQPAPTRLKSRPDAPKSRQPSSMFYRDSRNPPATSSTSPPKRSEPDRTPSDLHRPRHQEREEYQSRSKPQFRQEERDDRVYYRHQESPQKLQVPDDRVYDRPQRVAQKLQVPDNRNHDRPQSMTQKLQVPDDRNHDRPQSIKQKLQALLEMQRQDRILSPRGKIVEGQCRPREVRDLQLLLPPADVFKLPTQIERKEPSPPSEESASKDFVESNESASKDIVERIESASKDIVEKRETTPRKIVEKDANDTIHTATRCIEQQNSMMAQMLKECLAEKKAPETRQRVATNGTRTRTVGTQAYEKKAKAVPKTPVPTLYRYQPQNVMGETVVVQGIAIPPRVFSCEAETQVSPESRTDSGRGVGDVDMLLETLGKEADVPDYRKLIASEIQASERRDLERHFEEMLSPIRRLQNRTPESSDSIPSMSGDTSASLSLSEGEICTAWSVGEIVGITRSLGEVSVL